VVYDGKDISGLRTSAIAELGLVRTFQSTTLFQEFSVLDNAMVGAHLSVLDNAMVGAHLAARDSLFNTLLGRNLAREAEAEKRARETLEFFGLSDRADELASNLPHGLQRALGMAVALVAGPKLLLLDEPFTGMNPEETRHMMDLVRRVRDRGITILLVEHDMQAVMGLCDRITVLNFGQLLTEGAPDEIRLHPDVIEAYLGAAAGAA
jgi:branched-chain amino acid transport system ATP-binding protein